MGQTLDFYEIGWKRAGEFLYGDEYHKLQSEQIYERFCSQEENENKIKFISGWTDHLMD
jgi:hypothetical protein